MNESTLRIQYKIFLESDFNFIYTVNKHLLCSEYGGDSIHIQICIIRQ